MSKKASQSFASADAKAVLYVFCRDMCVAENTLRGVSVELSAFSGQLRRRTQRIFLEKAAKPLFRQSQALRFVRRRACSIPLSFPVVAVEEVPLYAVLFIGYHGVEVDVLHAAEDVRLDLGVRLLHAADKLLHLRPL